MQILHCNRGRQFFAQSFCVIQHILRFQKLAWLHHGTDDVSLTPLFHLFADKFIGLGTPLGIYHTIFNRLPALGKLVDDRDIQISIKDNSQGPRNGRSAHHQHMRIFSLSGEKLPLSYPEPMLLIGNHQSQIVILHFFLDQSVGADDQIGLVGADLLISLAFFPGCHGAGNQHSPDFHVPLGKQLIDRFKMLPGQDLRGSHESPLKAIVRSS